MKKEYKANLLIIGAPKCGTTSLVDWLIQHPEIGLEGNEKELFALIDEDNSLSEMEREYKINSSDEKIRVDGTVHYLYQKRALNYFLNNDSVRAIVVVRDPIDRLRSAFNFTKYSHSAVSESYSFEAYAKDLIGKNYRSIERNFDSLHSDVAISELKYGRYEEYISQWAVMKDRFLIVGFDDLKNNNSLVVDEIFSWLNLDASDVEYDISNESYVPRYRAINRFVKYLARQVPVLRQIKILRSVYAKFNHSKVKPGSDISEEVLNDLKEYYKNDIDFVKRVRLHG